MDSPAEQPAPDIMARLPRIAQWALLLLVSALIAGAMELAGLPAAFLIGPMLAAVIAGVNGATVRPPKAGFAIAQAVIGVLIAASIEIEIFASFLHDWPLFLGAVLATVAASSFLGWLISRWKILPGSTAVWGSSPGAATAMVLMADAFGADARLVAFMQYFRVILVSLAAALIAGLFVDTEGIAQPATVWFPALRWPDFAATLGIALVGALLGSLLRLPSPYFLGTMILGVALHLTGLVDFQLPPWLLTASFALIGWTIGLNFTRPIVRHAAPVPPQIAGSILALIAFCGGLAFLLSHVLGIDPLTAYLATSPGGMDSIAIIAAASNSVNLSFVMALQTARFLFVLLFGPAIARLIARAVKE